MKPRSACRLPVSFGQQTILCVERVWPLDCLQREAAISATQTRTASRWPLCSQASIAINPYLLSISVSDCCKALAAYDRRPSGGVDKAGLLQILGFTKLLLGQQWQSMRSPREIMPDFTFEELRMRFGGAAAGGSSSYIKQLFSRSRS